MRCETLQVNNSSQLFPDSSFESTVKAQKELVETLKDQWKLLWSERFNDKIRAEGVSVSNYAALKVEKGTIIHATRDFKPLNFKEILQQNMIENPERYMQPDTQTGGWNKFVKTKITSSPPQINKRALLFEQKKRNTQQPKKGGRGWLHSS